MFHRSTAGVGSCCDKRERAIFAGQVRQCLDRSLNRPSFPPIGCIFSKGSHVPDLVALVKWSWSCCCSELCAEASTESTQSNVTFKQKEKKIKQ